MADPTTLKSIYPILQNFIHKVSKKIHVQEAYLFGSYAKGTATTDSDIDVLIISPDFGSDHYDNLLQLMKLRRGIDLRIEPHPFSPKNFNESHPFFQEIKHNLIPISDQSLET